MIRIPLVVLLALAACDKKAPSDDKTAAVAATSKEKEKAKPAPPPEEPEQVSKTGVLELELATRGSRYTLRDATFEVVFPSRPNVSERKDSAPDGTKFTSGMALASYSGSELGFFVMPIPADATYDPEKGLAGARDGAIKNVGATILSETDAKIGGLAGRKVTASAMNGATKVYIDLYLAWDDGHRQMLGIFSGGTSSKPSAAATAFVDSLKVKAAAKKPAADPVAAKPAADAVEKVTKTGVLDLEIIEKAGMFTLHDSTYRVTFPSKPQVEQTDSAAPNGTKLPGAVATATIGNDQAYGMILIVIPKGIPYDAKKGMKGARDGMIRQVNAKVVSENAMKIAGVPGRRTIATATIDGQKLTLELQFAYDKKRHAVFGLYTATPVKEPPPAVLSFFSSFEITRT